MNINIFKQKTSNLMKFIQKMGRTSRIKYFKQISRTREGNTITLKQQKTKLKSRLISNSSEKITANIKEKAIIKTILKSALMYVFCSKFYSFFHFYFTWFFIKKTFLFKNNKKGRVKLLLY